MRPSLVLLTPLLVVQISAQSASPDILSILASQAFSIFTSLTSVVGNTPTSSPTRASVSPTTSDDSESLLPPFTSSLASVTSASTRARTSSTSSLSSPTTSASSGSTAQITPSPTSASSSANQSGAAAAASATSSTTASGGSNHDRNLAIILGTVLGALALGLFILLLLLLCRRRRRRAHTAQSASLTSNSDEALTAHHKTPRSRTTPLAAVFASRKSKDRRRSNGGAPLMSERSTYDVPSAHEFGHGDTVPFVPESGNPRRSSGILPPPAGSSVNSRGGLNSHPYSNNHHPGAVLAAGAGGAALGAAAARNSRSSERRHEPRISGDPEVHPAFWDEPPPRSPHRTSMDSSLSRRSGSMSRGTFRGPQDRTGSPLRNSVTTAAAGGLAGAAAGTAAGTLSNRNKRRSHERGRSISTNPPPYDAPINGPVPTTSTGMTDRNGVHHMAPVTAGQGNSGITNHSTMAPTLGGGALGAGVASQSRSRSRPRSYPPLPPSLIIPNPNARRNLPSRSPKRTRFGADTYHEPMPYENERLSQNTMSPPSTDHDHAWNTMGNPALADNPVVNGPVSPISPDDTARDLGHGRSATSGKTNLANVPRSRSISPNPTSRHSDHFLANNLPISPPTTDSHSTPTNDNIIQDSRPSRAPRQNSGLVNAVQGHFDSHSPSTTSQIQHHPPSYTAYKVPLLMPSGLPADDPAISSRTPKPLPRKPVPYRAYSSDDTWRSEEDSAWAHSYSNPTRTSRDGIGQAR